MNIELQTLKPFIMKTINLITRTITNVDFLFNALKYAFLALIAFSVVNLLVHWFVSPSDVFNASFGGF